MLDGSIVIHKSTCKLVMVEAKLIFKGATSMRSTRFLLYKVCPSPLSSILKSEDITVGGDVLLWNKTLDGKKPKTSALSCNC